MVLLTSIVLALAAVAASPSGVPRPAAPSTGAPALLRLSGPGGVPRAAAPASGAPTPLQIDPDIEDPDDAPEARYTPLPETGFDPLSVFRESRMPRTPDPSKPRRKRKRDPSHRFLPLPHVSSQPATGLTLGGSLNYSYRKPGEQFNRAYGVAWSRVSTRGVQDHILSARLRDILGRKEIFQFGIWISLDPVFPFYGVNNHKDLRGTDLSGPYNRMRMDNYGGWLTYEHPLWQLHRPGRPVGTLRHYSGVFYYIDVVHGYPGSRLPTEIPQYREVTRRGTLRGGVSWDSRDNDWSPNEGSLIDVTVDATGVYTGSTSNWGRLHASVRHYWSLGDSGMVLAHRVTFDGLAGKAPLMAMGEFGGLFPMDAYGGAFVGRGFSRRRFIGNYKATAGLELRFKPLERRLGRHHIGLGFESFLEVGLVSMRLAELFNHAYLSGGPGLLLIWDRFVVFRVETGFSREGSAIYLQSEHAF